MPCISHISDYRPGVRFFKSNDTSSIMKNNITSGIGIGEVQFGMLSSQVRRILGVPNEIEIFAHSEEGDDGTENWHYEDLELSISFSQEDEWKLDIISTTSAKFSFMDAITVNQSIKEVKKSLQKLGYKDLQIEDSASIEIPNHKVISVGEIGIDFWFENDKLSEIQMTPLWEDDETIIWPNILTVEGESNGDALIKHDSDVLFDKLDEHINEWVIKIFDPANAEEFSDLISDFPSGTTLDHLSFERESVNYYLNIQDKPKGTMEAKVSIVHSEAEIIGAMSLVWDENLEMVNDFWVLEGS